MKFPIFDLHCDTASKMICNPDWIIPLRENDLHIDLKRTTQFQGYAQCFACFTTTENDCNPMLSFEKQMIAVLSELKKNKQFIRQAFTSKDIIENRNQGVASAILTLEGSAGIGFDPLLLEDLYKIGFRISSLGWNEKNPLTGSQATGGGLTELGVEYVKEAQRLGMIVDVSHISDEGFWDIMDITQAPIVATHSNSRSLCDVKRNLSDEMFREICNTDGVIGINLYADFLGEHPDLDTICRHIFHFLEIDPNGRHIAFGGDLDGCETLACGFTGVESYPTLAEYLLARGLDETTLYNIFWNNAMGVMERCCM